MFGWDVFGCDYFFCWPKKTWQKKSGFGSYQCDYLYNYIDYNRCSQVHWWLDIVFFLCDDEIPIVLPWIMYLVNKTQEERTCCEKKMLDPCHPTASYSRRDIPLKTSPQNELEFQWTATRLGQYVFRFWVCRAAWHSYERWWWYTVDGGQDAVPVDIVDDSIRSQ